MALSASEISIVLRAYDEASATIRTVEKSADSLGGTFAKVGQNALGVAAGIAAIAGAGQAFNALGSVIVGFNSKIEQSTIAWTTFTGSADAAHGIIQQIQQIAATTPFEFKDVDNASKRFTNAGFSAQQALDFIKPLSNAVASVGLGAEGVDRVSLALAQMTQKTRVQGQEMLQLTEAQIPAWDILAQATGKPIPELQKLVEQGRISAKQFTDAFGVFYGETGKFANAAHDQSLTFQGSMSTIRDELNIVGSTAFKPLFDVLSQAARAFAAFVQSDAFTVWGAKIQAVVGFIVDSIMGLSGAFSSTLGGILDVVNTVGQAIYAGLQWLNPFAAHSEPLVSQVEQGVAAIQASYESLGGLTATFGSLGDAFGTLGVATDAFSSTVDGLSTKTEKALAVMGPGVTAAFNEASAAIDVAKGSLADIKTAWDDAADALVPLKDNLDAAKDALKDQQTTLGDLRSSLADAKASFDPLNEALKDAEQNAKDAEQAIKSLTTAPIEGTAAFDTKISAANIGLKQQALALSNVKQSTAYQTLGNQIETASAKLKEMQRTQATFIPSVSSSATDAQKKAHADAVENNRVLAASARDAIAQQQAGLEVLKAKQQDMLGPAQKELDTRRNVLDAINLEKDATIGVAQERIKATAAAALGIKEQTEGQITVAIAAAKAARGVASDQVATLSPQVAAQQAVIDGLTSKIRDQDRAVRDAQATTDAANTTYSDAKEKVDDLGTAYRDTKAQVASYEQQLKTTIAAGDMQVQKIKEAKKAADDAAKATGSGAVTAKTDVLAGLDIEGSKAKIKAFSDQVAATRADITGHLDAISDKWNAIWSSVSTVLDKVLARFGGFAVVQPAIAVLQRFAGIAAGLAAALVIATPIIGLFGAALAPIGALVALALTPVGLLVVGIAALTAAWTLNIGNIQQSAAGLAEAFVPLQLLPNIIEKALGGDVSGALIEFVDVLSATRTRIIEVLAGWAGAFVDWLLPQVPALMTQLTTFASAIVGWILVQGDKYLTQLLEWGKAFVDWIAPRWPMIRAALGTIANGIAQWIIETSSKLIEWLAKWGKSFLDWIGPMVPGLLRELVNIYQAVVLWIIQTSIQIVEKLAVWAAAFLEWIVPLIPDFLRMLGGLAESMIGWIVNDVLPLLNTTLLKWGGAFLSWVAPFIIPMLVELGKLLFELMTWIPRHAEDIAKKLAEWGSAFVNWITTEVLPNLGAALDVIINGGAGWEGLAAWIPRQAKALAGLLGTWAAEFVNWITNPGGALTALTVELPKIVNAIDDWLIASAKSISQTGQDIAAAMIKGLVSGLLGLAGAIGPVLVAAWEEAKTNFIKNLNPVGGGGGGGGSGTNDATPQAGRSARAGWEPTIVEAYIRETARKYGINPNTAARVAGSEGLNNPVGDAGLSFGPFQLYTGGGLGNQFQQQTGLDPADYQNNWKAQVDFALKWAKQNGWNPGGVRTPTGATGGGFHGATAAGISNWEGLSEVATDAVPALQDFTSTIDESRKAVEHATPALTDYGFTISSLPDYIRPGGEALDWLAAQTGKPRGAFLEMAQSVQADVSATVDAAATLANQFGISLDSADKIIQDHGSIAKQVLGVDIPGSMGLTDKAVEDFADAFGVNWDQARKILQSTGAISDAVMGQQIPKAAGLTTTAVDAAGVSAGNLKKPVDDATSAAKSLAKDGFDVAKEAVSAFGGKQGEIAANISTQIAAVLLQLRDGLLGEGDYSGKGLIQAVKDFGSALLALPTDIKVTITTEQAGSMAASGGGNFAQSGISEGSSRNNVSSGGVGNLADQSVRATLRTQGYAVGQNSDGTYYAEKRAGGGSVGRGVPYFVGEHGPELFTPQQSGSISPNGMGGGIDYTRLAAAIANAMQSAPAPRVDVEEIRSSLVRIGSRNSGYVGLA